MAKNQTSHIKTLCTEDGIRYEHHRTITKYLFKENKQFFRNQEYKGAWSIINLDQNTSLLKMDYKGPSKGPAYVYFRWPLQKGINKSITEIQTDPYKTLKLVTLEI